MTLFDQVLARGETFYTFKDGSGMIPHGRAVREFSGYEDEHTMDMDDVFPMGRIRQVFLLFRKWVQENDRGVWFLPELAFYPDGAVELLDDYAVRDDDEVEHGPVLQRWDTANEARIWFQTNT